MAWWVGLAFTGWLIYEFTKPDDMRRKPRKKVKTLEERVEALERKVKKLQK